MRPGRTAAALTTAALALIFAAPAASAAEPTEQACLGEFFAESATSAGVLFGQDVRNFAQNAEAIGLRNLGEGIGVLQSGESTIFPTVCQSG